MLVWTRHRLGAQVCARGETKRGGHVPTWKLQLCSAKQFKYVQLQLCSGICAGVPGSKEEKGWLIG